MDINEMYKTLAAAAVRGYEMRTSSGIISPELIKKPLEELSDDETAAIINAGQKAGVKLYRFKKTHDNMPRVKAVIGILKGIMPDTLLDIGSGRGVFLFPFLNTFPNTQVTSLDILDYRVDFLKDIAAGGVSRLTALKDDICKCSLKEKSADIVTMLEVLEHIPDVQSAVNSAVRIAKRHVIVSVPSKPDNNPEHIHLLTKQALTELFENAGAGHLSFSGVNGHLIMTANTEVL